MCYNSPRLHPYLGGSSPGGYVICRGPLPLQTHRSNLARNASVSEVISSWCRPSSTDTSQDNYPTHPPPRLPVMAKHAQERFRGTPLGGKVLPTVPHGPPSPSWRLSDLLLVDTCLLAVTRGVTTPRLAPYDTDLFVVQYPRLRDQVATRSASAFSVTDR